MPVVTLDATEIKGAYEPAATAVVDISWTFAIATATSSTKTFTLGAGDGDQTARFPTGKRFRVSGSSADDGIYTVVSSAFGTETSIVVSETVAADGSDGDIIVGAFEPAATGGDTNDWICTGREIVLVRNVHASAAKTFTITSVANLRGRTGDITAHSLDAGAQVILPLFKSDGWASGGLIACTGEDANIEFAVLRLPAN